MMNNQTSVCVCFETFIYSLRVDLRKTVMCIIFKSSHFKPRDSDRVFALNEYSVDMSYPPKSKRDPGLGSWLMIISYVCKIFSETRNVSVLQYSVGKRETTLQFTARPRFSRNRFRLLFCYSRRPIILETLNVHG